MCAEIKSQSSIQQIPRREFLSMTSLTMLSASIFRGLKTFPVEKPAKIALQLYTLRNQIKNNITDTLHKVADIGFETVETAFWPETISVKEAGKHLSDAGLKFVQHMLSCPSVIKNLQCLK